MLKFVEMLHSVEAQGEGAVAHKHSMTRSGDVRATRDSLDAMQAMETRAVIADHLVQVMDLWKEGVLIMDEVPPFPSPSHPTHRPPLLHPAFPPTRALCSPRPRSPRWMCCCTR